MKYAEAFRIATKVWEELYPHCECALIAGSVRRKKREVKDIECVLIPKPYNTGIFEDGLASVVNKWKKIKGELEYGKTRYTQRELPEGINLDIFIADKNNLGYIFMLRTGSSEWNQRVMLSRLKGNGYKAHEGYIWYGGEKIPIPTEEHMFRAMGLEFVKPENRI